MICQKPARKPTKEMVDLSTRMIKESTKPVSSTKCLMSTTASNVNNSGSSSTTYIQYIQ